MIREEIFKNIMSETLALLNTTVSGKQAMIDAMYDRVKDNFIEQDLRKACDELLNPDKDFHKFSYPLLIKAMSKARSYRYERYSQEQKKKSEDSVKSFWAAEYEATCTTHVCSTCPKIAGRCDTIAKHTMGAIKLMLKRQWREKKRDESWQDYYFEVRAGQQTHNKAIIDELARQFPGVGFGLDYGKERELRDKEHQINFMKKKEQQTESPKLRIVKQQDIFGDDAHDF